MEGEFKFKAQVWVYEGDSWHFVTIKKKVAEEIKRFDSGPRRGFGSIPVDVTVGKTKWKTSIFPIKDGSFMLPLKKEVRARENIKERDKIKLIIQMRM